MTPARNADRSRLAAALLGGLMWLSAASVAQAADAGIAANVQHTLATMTLEEKIGQMTQVTLATLQTPGQADGTTVDPALLDTALNRYAIGSVINVSSEPLTLDEWHALMRTLQDAAGRTHSKIPLLYGIDAIHGASYTRGSTLFPHNIGLAAARDPELVSRIAAVTAMEVRASGIRWNFDPVLDTGRNPLWARFEETYGEDSYLGSTLGVAVVTAYERDGLASPTAVAACMKHYLGYSDPASGKDRTPAYIPDVELWQHHLPSFRAAVAAGASTIMINSGSVNGTPLHADKRLLGDVLRGELGFRGVIVSDWEDVIRLHTRHAVAATPRDAVRLAVEAGIDISMVPDDFSFATLLLELVRNGAVSEDRIDESVARILTLKYRLGLFDNPYPEPAAAENFARPEYSELALRAALESITLLENRDRLLPLAADTRLLVAGPAAANLGALHGSWSYSWQGNVEALYPASTRSVDAALAARAGKDHVTSLASAEFSAAQNVAADALRRASANADVILLALGEPSYAESPGAIDDLTLPADQRALAAAAFDTGKPVVVVMLSGRPRVLGDIVSRAAAILYAYRPGSRGADAIAKIVYGDSNPSGVLPFSYPRATGDIVPYDRRVLADVREVDPGQPNVHGYRPQWPFGYGLSYTNFEVRSLTLDRDVLHGDEPLQVTVQVANSGQRDGEHVVELYVRDQYASLSPAARKLRRFRRVAIPHGKTVDVSFTLGSEDLAFWGRDLRQHVEAGGFTVMAGPREATFEYRD